MVLAGGTLLAGQVQGDLDAGIRERTAESKGGETPPLKLNDFTLPKDVPLQLPEGAEISPDLSKVTLPEDMDLQLPSDLDLGALGFELPPDFQLDLPEGTVFSPPGLTLPEGATLRLPDGREFTLPAGSQLDLPPEVVQRLLEQGLPSGRLDADRTFDMRGLPEGLEATLDPPQFDGAGHLRLPGGTTITLPEGHRFPFPAGLLPHAIRYLLPAGSSFDIPVPQGGEFSVPRAGSSSQLVRDGETGPRIAVETEITKMPSTVKKGEPFTVSGYVRERGSGRPVAGAPVDVFLNESKRATGTLVGQSTSDASGIFTAKLLLPSDKPAREYQLVNHAVAFVGVDGRAFADGWGDPPLTAYADTVLTLLVPARDGFGVSTTIAGALVDNTGHPVAGMPVAVSVDGKAIARPVTNAQGRFAFQHAFSPGEHEVDAQFLGAQAYRASPIATAGITIDKDALDVPPIVRGRPGESVALTGRVFADGAAAPGRAVTIRGPFDPSELSVTTDATGRFSLATVLPASLPPGAHAVTYRVVSLDITKSQLVEANQTARILLSAPTSWDVEEPIPISAQVLAGGRGIPDQALRFTLAGPGGARDVDVVTDASGTVSATLLPLRDAPGAYLLTASTSANPYLLAPAESQSIALGIFEVSWELPRTVVRGTDLHGAATLRFAGKPYADTPVSLDVGGPMALTTDANGRISFVKPLSLDTELGLLPVSVKALDHPLRARNVTVMAMPRLALDGPAEFPVGGKPEASFRLTDDHGEPLRDRDVLLRVGNFEQSVTTDRRGRWSGTLDVLVGEDNVTLAARFDEASPYLGAEDAQVLVASAELAARPSPLLWIAPLVGLSLVGAGGAGWYAYTRWRRFPAPAPAAAPVAVALARHAPDFDLRIGIPEGEPAVWGVGEPLAVKLRNRGRAGDVELAWEGGATRLALAEQAGTTLTFREEGEIVLRARRAGAASMEEAEVALRIVDYRKETAREFDLFVERAQTLDASLTRRSTPREMQFALARHLGPAAEAELEEMALVMEVTNYSHHLVGRAHYLRFVRASRALDPFLVRDAEE